MPDASLMQKIAHLFRRNLVLRMSDLECAAGPRSQRSLFRDLAELGYLSSYTHAGRYYTLASIPEFGAEGLWRYEGIGFSRDGTLKATVERLVRTSEAGRTQHELRLGLGVRVHNPLLDLVEAKKLRRETVGDQYVYLAPVRVRAREQMERRRAVASAPPAPALEVEVLLEVIHGARVPPPDAAWVAARLGARGIRAGVTEVAAVLDRHGLKKTPLSRSRRWRP